MASIDPASFLQELTKYTKSVQSDSSLYDKSKCEKFLSDIDEVLASDPAHAQKRSFEHHRATLVGFLSSRNIGGGQSDVPNLEISKQIPVDHESLEGLLDQEKLDRIKTKGGSMILQWIPPNNLPPYWNFTYAAQNQSHGDYTKCTICSCSI